MFFLQFCTLYHSKYFLKYFLTHPCANHQAHIKISTHETCHAHQTHNHSPNHTKHINTRACSVLVLSRDFLGNLIPKSNIEPHPVMMLSLDYGLSPNFQSIGFHIPILHIKPPSSDGYPNPSSLGIHIPTL